MDSPYSTGQIPKGYSPAYLLVEYLAEKKECCQGDIVRAVLEQDGKMPGSIRTKDIPVDGRSIRVYCIDDLVQARIISCEDYERPDEPRQSSANATPREPSKQHLRIFFSKKSIVSSHRKKSAGGLDIIPPKKIDGKYVADGDHAEVSGADGPHHESESLTPGSDQEERIGHEQPDHNLEAEIDEGHSDKDITTKYGMEGGNVFFSQFNHSLLTREQEVEYAKQMEDGLSGAAKLLFGEASDFFMRYFQAIDAATKGITLEGEVGVFSQHLPKRRYNETLAYLKAMITGQQDSDLANGDNGDDENGQEDTKGCLSKDDEDVLGMLTCAKHRYTRLQMIYEDMKSMADLARLRPSRSEQNRAASQMGFRNMKEMDSCVSQIGGYLQKAYEAEDKMVSSNLKLVASIAYRYREGALGRKDHLQNGNMGLIEGVERFDWRKGYKLSTYIRWWIRQSINRYLVDTGKTVRLPVHVVEGISKIKKLEREYMINEGRLPKEDELVERMGVSIKTLRNYIRSLRKEISMQKQIGEDDSGLAIEDVLGCAAYNPETFMQDKEKRSMIEDYLSKLSPREEQVIKLRFGLCGESDHTLGQTAGILTGLNEEGKPNLTRERIRQIEKKALEKLEKVIKKHHQVMESRMKQYGRMLEMKEQGEGISDNVKRLSEPADPSVLSCKRYDRPIIRELNEKDYFTSRELAAIFRIKYPNILYPLKKREELGLVYECKRNHHKYAFTKNLVQLLEGYADPNKPSLMKKYCKRKPDESELAMLEGLKQEIKSKGMGALYGKPLTIRQLADIFMLDKASISRRINYKRKELELVHSDGKTRPICYTFDENLAGIIEKMVSDKGGEPIFKKKYSKPLISDIYRKEYTAKQLTEIFRINDIRAFSNKLNHKNRITLRKLGKSYLYTVDDALKKVINRFSAHPTKKYYEPPRVREETRESISKIELTLHQLAALYGYDERSLSASLHMMRGKLDFRYETPRRIKYRLTKTLREKLEAHADRVFSGELEKSAKKKREKRIKRINKNKKCDRQRKFRW